jgi:hypothetical protein
MPGWSMRLGVAACGQQRAPAACGSLRTDGGCSHGRRYAPPWTGRHAIQYTLTRKRYTVQVRKAYCTCTKGAWLRFHSGGRAGSVVGADWRLRIGSPVAA